MAHPQAIEVLVRRVERQVGVRRAEHWGLRGAFWGALLAAAVLAFKAVLGLAALVLAPALVLLGALAGAAYGLARRVAPRDAARLADRAFGLADRVATALEWADHPDRTPLVDALVADTVARVLALEPRQIVRRVIPLEGRWLPAPLLAGLVLALAPAIHLPTGTILDFTPSAEQEQHEDRASTEMTAERSRPLPRDPLKRPSFEERDFAQRTGTGSGSTAGDLSAIFKDTALSNQRPDFNSFLKKGDERLRLLEQVDRLPDLQSDFTTTQYKMVFRKSKSLMSGLSPDISPQKLRELLDEMERLGRKGGNWSSDAGESVPGAARASGLRTRTSARARGSCPARAGAPCRRAIRRRGCAATLTMSASRVSRAAAGRMAMTRTSPAAQARCRRASCTSGWS